MPRRRIPTILVQVGDFGSGPGTTTIGSDEHDQPAQESDNESEIETKTTVRRPRILAPVPVEFVSRCAGRHIIPGDHCGVGFQRLLFGILGAGVHPVVGIDHDGPVDPFQLVHAGAIAPPEHDTGLQARVLVGSRSPTVKQQQQPEQEQYQWNS